MTGRAVTNLNRQSVRATLFQPSGLSGFTLVELMVAIVVVAILLGIAIPSFTEMTLSSRLRSYANDLVASANLARAEAIKRNAVVALCVSTDGTSCAVGSWEQGWLVFHDADKSGALDAGETVIQRQQAAASGYLISSSDAVSVINFQPSGVGSTQTTLTVCRQTPSEGSQERVVTISATGRTSVAKTTNASCP